jgi:hypothetical protein
MPRIQNQLGFLAHRHPEETKQRDDDEPGRFAIICYTRGKKKQINDDEPRRLVVIYYT